MSDGEEAGTSTGGFGTMKVFLLLLHQLVYPLELQLQSTRMS
jgi:hypothetical protein